MIAGLLRRLRHRHAPGPVPPPPTAKRLAKPPYPPRPAREPVDPVDQARNELRAALYALEDPGVTDGLADLFTRLGPPPGSGPRPSGCWLCEPQTPWLDKAVCAACEKRPPFRISDPDER